MFKNSNSGLDHNELLRTRFLAFVGKIVRRLEKNWVVRVQNRANYMDLGNYQISMNRVQKSARQLN